jgi:hypothetical protein
VSSAITLEGGQSLASVLEGPYYIRVDKLLRESGLADSASDGVRKLKQNAVRIEGQVVSSVIFSKLIPVQIAVRVGKKIKNVQIIK